MVPMNRLAGNLARAAFVTVLALTLWGCRADSDKLYAMKVETPPSVEMWRSAYPLRLEASGGATSLPSESMVDSDSVHKVTASCHHGTGAPTVKVELRAFYTAEKLYLRVKWGDPTPDEGPNWTFADGKYRASGQVRDGLGILWGGPQGEGARGFNCMRSCHMDDWRMAGDRGFADYMMRTPDQARLDFWIWRAGRGDGIKAGGVEDGYLGPEGKEGDTPGEFEKPNSTLAAQEGCELFGEGDQPLVAPEGGPGMTAPGYLIVDDSAGRNEVDAVASHTDGQWVLTLSRDLTPLDLGDVVFTAGVEYQFGLALLDGVALDHNAVNMPVTLVVVDPDRITTE